jgi:UDP-N-acetylglucosamine 2-epimerase
MKLMLVIGARPQIIKSAPVIHEALEKSEIQLQLIHTGQHYDYKMSRIFFGELDLPEPMVNLGIGSGTHAFQTGRMIIELEKRIEDLKPDVALVPGDTNSTLAGALAAVKLHIPVAHIEAGARSYDMQMPEEINRRLTDHCSSLLFAPTRNCVEQLVQEGIQNQRIMLSGDTMYDAMIQHMKDSEKSKILNEFGLRGEEYAILTLHRPENVDAYEKLQRIIRALITLKDLAIVFPVHPRTKQRLAKISTLKSKEAVARLRLVEPVGYQDMLHLTQNAKIVFTDSGGLQKEAFWLHTPCITLRDRTEWIETTHLGANTVVGDSPRRILKTTRKIMETKDAKAKLAKLANPFGDGKASQRIIKQILKAN